MDLSSHQTREFAGETVVCNIDPKRAAKMIEESHFSAKVRRKLDYEYSASNYMAYCVVKDLDLRDYGFGEWNLFHTEQPNLNEAFAQMYEHHDYLVPALRLRRLPCLHRPAVTVQKTVRLLNS